MYDSLLLVNKSYLRIVKLRFVEFFLQVVHHSREAMASAFFFGARHDDSCVVRHTRRTRRNGSKRSCLGS